MTHYIIFFILLASFSLQCMELNRSKPQGSPADKTLNFSSSTGTNISNALREAGFVPLEKLSRQDDQPVTELDRDFFEACKTDNFPKAVDTFKRGANVLINDANNMNPLFYSIQNSNIPLASLILQKGGRAAINPDLPLLMRAAILRNTALFFMLRENGAQFRPAENIVTLALQSGNVSLARYAICEGAPVEDQAIFIAMNDNYDDVVFLLLNPKFEKDGPVQLTGRMATPTKEPKKTHVSLEATENSLGFTPLLRAARLNKKEIGLRMLECGADCNARTSIGATALWFASLHNNTELALALLSYDASANISAQVPNDLVDLINTPAQNGQNYGPTEWWAPLLLAAKNGNAELLDGLLQKSADYHTVLSTKQNGLHLAVRANSAACVQILALRDIRLNVGDKEGVTPLQLARELNLPEIERILIDCGAETVAEKNCTPLAVRRMSVSATAPSPRALATAGVLGVNSASSSPRIPGRDSARGDLRHESPRPGSTPRTPVQQQSPREVTTPKLLKIPSEKLLGSNPSLSPMAGALRRSAHGD